MHLFPIYDIILFNILHHIFQYIAIYYRFIRDRLAVIAGDVETATVFV